MCALVTGVQTWALPIWHVLAAPLRLETHAEEADADFVRDRLQLLEMAGDLAAGLVDRLDGRTRQFELPGRFERDRSAIALQGDELAVLGDGLPTEAGHALEQGTDALRAFPRWRAKIVEPERKSVGEGKRVSVRVGLGGGRSIKKKTK